ncbi:MAG: antibiotic biosynthesis monooxygenase [Deltaproteobacteria bacterium]|nr:antibiotic biosynthesis monooxygenase [Deltaproteobacteria bacterium]
MNPARTPEPPYWAVIFTSQRTDADQGYAAMADRMEALAKEQPGFLGLEHAGDASGSITVSYWSSTDAIAAWKAVVEHREAQHLGRERWYARFQLRVCKVERAYGFERT